MANLVATDLSHNERRYISDHPHTAFGFHVQTAKAVKADAPEVQKADAQHGMAIVVSPFNVLGGSAMHVITTPAGMKEFRADMAAAGTPVTQLHLLRRGGDDGVLTYNIKPKSKPVVRDAVLVAR